MRQRTLERWLAVLLVAAASGWLCARVVLAPRIAIRIARALRRDAVAIAPVHAAVRASPVIVAPSAAVEIAPVPSVAAPVAPRRRPAPVPLPFPARLSRIPSGGFRLDLRNLPDPLVLARGLVILPDTLGGFRIVVIDRAGFLAAAGIAPGDRVVGLDDRPVLTADDALDALVHAQRARHVVIHFARGGTHYAVPVDLWRTGEP